jgi:hypothetical protein
MNRLVISHNETELTAVIKNLCSLQYNKEEGTLDFASANEFIKTKFDRLRIGKKSITFVYNTKITKTPIQYTEKELALLAKMNSVFQTREQENRVIDFIYFCKSRKNTYEIKVDQNNSGGKRICVTMPSVIFKQFRRNFYDMKRDYLLNQLESKIYVTCAEGKKQLVYAKNRIFLQEQTDATAIKEVQLVKFDVNQVVFKIDKEIYHVTNNRGQRSFTVDNMHVGRIYNDVSFVLDVWQYFMIKPPTIEDYNQKLLEETRRMTLELENLEF